MVLKPTDPLTLYVFHYLTICTLHMRRVPRSV